jgi:CDP-glucose 4,6-dehydratase
MSDFAKHYAGKRILVTGHTGFKGAWLTTWLKALGAQVIGYSLPPPTQPSLFALTNLEKQITHVIGDITDFNLFKNVCINHQPEMIFHLAAQPIVLHAYDDPKHTFDTNVGGTVNVLEIARHVPSIKAVLCITTDKCYHNNEWIWGYRENDRLGGADPYSASKAMAEMTVASYRASFFSKEKARKVLVASARAGNVIGGGDFSEYRLVPDCMKALLRDEPIVLRNPRSVRPWLNILEVLQGYLQLGAKLLDGDDRFAEAWNFGPQEIEGITTQALIEEAITLWGKGKWIQPKTSGEPHHEMGMLRLNWDKAANLLKWHPRLTWKEAIQETVEWFKAYQRYTVAPSEVHLQTVCLEQIQAYSQHPIQSFAHV